MPNNNSLKSNINVLITRPENEGRRLATKLNTLGINTQCQPMFDYRVNDNLTKNGPENLAQRLNQVNQPIVIFISVAAVTSANGVIDIASWQASKVFAVGTATAKALKALHIDVISPKLQTSEGLLALPALQSIEGQDILIVRGDGGREYLADSLNEKNGIVYYIEAYQRIWRQLPNNIQQHWLSHQINCMVITSDAILQSIVQLINLSDEYWQTDCYWLVASERIAQNAKALGLKRVINSNGASDNAITNVITSDVTINME